jgi:hypothetical protein
VPAKKSDKQGKQRRTPAGKPDADSAEVAFDEIMDAILGADPKVIKEHHTKRRKTLVERNVKPTTRRGHI